MADSLNPRLPLLLGVSFQNTSLNITFFSVRTTWTTPRSISIENMVMENGWNKSYIFFIA